MVPYMYIHMPVWYILIVSYRVSSPMKKKKKKKKIIIDVGMGKQEN